MKSAASLLAFASLALSSPLLFKRSTTPTPTETQILQFALTLEHLENTFYTQFLNEFSEEDFAKAGFEPFVRGRFEQISEHEATHVAFLTGVLGPDAPAACTYDFPVKTVEDFVTVSQVLEGVGVTAYLGAAQFLTTPSTLTDAGSILTTEARQNAWINSVVFKSFPWSQAFDTPQTLDEVFSLASPMIVSCPASNPTLVATAFPALTATPTTFPEDKNSAGQKISLTFANSAPTGQFLVLKSGMTVTAVPIVDGSATLPGGLQGTVFALVSKDQTAADASTIAGPAILTFPFSSNVANP